MANISGNIAHRVTMPTTLGSGAWTIPFRHFQDATHDHFIVNWPGYLVFVDRATGAILNTVAYSNSAAVAFRNSIPTLGTWFDYDSQSSVVEVSAIDGAVLRVIDLNLWDVGATANQAIYDPINHAWIGFFEGDLTWYYLDRIGGDGVELRQI